MPPNDRSFPRRNSPAGLAMRRTGRRHRLLMSLRNTTIGAPNAPTMPHRRAPEVAPTTTMVDRLGKWNLGDIFGGAARARHGNSDFTLDIRVAA